MKFLKSIPVFITVFLIANQVALADQESSIEQGEKLVRQVWTAMKDGNIEAIENWLAQGFQSIHQDGARNREQEIELIKGLNLGEYTLSDFTVTQNGPVILVTYFVSVVETIDDKRLSSTPAARLSGFLKTDDGWKWIVHANLKPIEDKK